MMDKKPMKVLHYEESSDGFIVEGHNELIGIHQESSELGRQTVWLAPHEQVSLCEFLRATLYGKQD